MVVECINCGVLCDSEDNTDCPECGYPLDLEINTEEE